MTLIVERGLNRAERIWQSHGVALDEAVARADSGVVTKDERVSSRIPGQKVVEAGKEHVGTFIAFVADIRDSSKHLLSAISGRRPSQLQRVLYETSALLPALEKTIQYNSGSVTEYLGDGLLAFFEVDDADKETAVRSAYRAAANCLHNTRDIVNKALQDRYTLPPLDLGIGLAMSKAVVSLVGVEGNSHAKVIGPCVYYATKLANGKNEIVVHELMRQAWPSSKGGQLRFERRSKGDIEGYVVSRATD